MLEPSPPSPVTHLDTVAHGALARLTGALSPASALLAGWTGVRTWRCRPGGNWPWRSVHKLQFLTATDITFVLTSGGHNAGIVSPPGRPHRHCRMLRREAGGSYVAPDAWLDAAPEVEGSWWPGWQQWLAGRSGRRMKPPRMGATG